MGSVNGFEAVVIVDAAGNVSTVASGATDSGSPIKVGGVYNATPITLTTGQRGDLQLNAKGFTRAEIGDATGAVAVVSGQVDAGSNAVTGLVVRGLGAVFNGSTWDRMRGDTNGVYAISKPVTAGGLSMGRILTGTTGFIKASAGQVYGLNAYNANAAVRYLHLYNKASAPTLSTDTPVWTIPLPASGQVVIPAGEIGAAFSTGIAWAYTTDDIAIPAAAGTSAELHASVLYA